MPEPDPQNASHAPEPSAAASRESIINRINLPAPEPPRSALGASLKADYEALQNDLDQAKELAADFQRQLAGKSNEVAHFKALLERTQKDFTRLEEHIDQLRQERHRLANEVMRVTALDAQLHQKTVEIERLRDQLETLRKASSQRVEELLLVSEEQQREITRLRAMVEVFRRREGAQAAPASETPAPTAAEAAAELVELRAKVKRLQEQLEQRAFTPREDGAPRAGLDPDVINLSFER